MEFTNPGLFLDLPFDKLVCALLSRNPPHTGQDGVYSIEIPPNYDTQGAYRRTCRMSVPRFKERIGRDFTWGIGEGQFEAWLLAKEVNKHGQSKFSIPHRWVWSFIFEETLVPRCRCQSYKHLGRFLSCGMRGKEPETHGRHACNSREGSSNSMHSCPCFLKASTVLDTARKQAGVIRAIPSLK